MRTWRMAKDRCYLCGIKEGSQYSFTLEEEDAKGNPISREVGSSARLIEAIRRFDKDNEVVFYICTRCELLTVLDPEREFFRFTFPEEELKPIKVLNLIKWADDLTATTIAQAEQIASLTKDIAKLRDDKAAEKKEEPPKEEESPKERLDETGEAVTVESEEDTTKTDMTGEATLTKTEEEKKDE